ncbi:unnamed protein product, partial [Prorocentrum cordatum]
MLGAVVDVFESAGVAHFLDYGSALGAHRLRGVLPGDADADLGVLAADYARAERALRSGLPGWLEVCLLPREGASELQQVVVRLRGGGACHDKPNVDVYGYAWRAGGDAGAAGGAQGVLERADLADRRGPHYGAVAARLALPAGCACLGGRGILAPLATSRATSRSATGAWARSACRRCEQDPAFEGRGVYYRPVQLWRDPAELLREMRERARWRGGRNATIGEKLSFF